MEETLLPTSSNATHSSVAYADLISASKIRCIALPCRSEQNIWHGKPTCKILNGGSWSGVGSASLSGVLSNKSQQVSSSLLRPCSTLRNSKVRRKETLDEKYQGVLNFICALFGLDEMGWYQFARRDLMAQLASDSKIFQISRHTSSFSLAYYTLCFTWYRKPMGWGQQGWSKHEAMTVSAPCHAFTCYPLARRFSQSGCFLCQIMFFLSHHLSLGRIYLFLITRKHNMVMFVPGRAGCPGPPDMSQQVKVTRSLGHPTSLQNKWSQYCFAFYMNFQIISTPQVILPSGGTILVSKCKLGSRGRSSWRALQVTFHRKKGIYPHELQDYMALVCFNLDRPWNSDVQVKSLLIIVRSFVRLHAVKEMDGAPPSTNLDDVEF